MFVVSVKILPINDKSTKKFLPERLGRNAATIRDKTAHTVREIETLLMISTHKKALSLPFRAVHRIMADTISPLASPTAQVEKM